MDLEPPGGREKPDGTVDWPGLSRDSRYTESRDDLRKIYELAQYGQLNNEIIEQLSSDQLTYLAAHDPAVASFETAKQELQVDRQNAAQKGHAAERLVLATRVDDLDGRRNKLEQNARRARLEIERRRNRETQAATRKATLTAAVIGGCAALVAGLMAFGGFLLAPHSVTVRYPVPIQHTTATGSTTTRPPSPTTTTTRKP